jgi:DNA-3-methyladenine glycosylase
MELFPRYERAFYLQDTLTVARSLIGSRLYTSIEGKLTGGMIVETEAYMGAIDKASHSYQGKRTKRTEIQFGVGGYAYVYFIYGKYYQLGVVTGLVEVPELVFVRALEPIVGIDTMQKRRNIQDMRKLTNGPGRLCLSLKITKELYGVDLCGDTIWISPGPQKVDDQLIAATKRIGIAYAEEDMEKDWRFYLRGNPYISKK